MGSSNDWNGMDFDEAFTQFTNEYSIPIADILQQSPFLGFQHEPEDHDASGEDVNVNSISEQHHEPESHIVHNSSVNHVRKMPNSGPNSFNSLLNDQESWALNHFLEKVSADPNFLFDPKIADELLNLSYRDNVNAFSGLSHHQVNGDPLSAVDTLAQHAHSNIHNSENLDTNKISLDSIDGSYRNAHVERNNSLSAQSERTPFASVTHVVSEGIQALSTNDMSSPENIQSIEDQATSDLTDYRDTGPLRMSSSHPGKRSNLSEDQKRLNHISSEKRRRDLIKRQFETMCSMVPKLANRSQEPNVKIEENGNSTSKSVPYSYKSKSAVLIAVYEYLVYLIAQNRSMRTVLRQLGVNYSVIPDSCRNLEE
jgi:hypothetical protein